MCQLPHRVRSASSILGGIRAVVVIAVFFCAACESDLGPVGEPTDLDEGVDAADDGDLSADDLALQDGVADPEEDGSGDAVSMDDTDAGDPGETDGSDGDLSQEDEWEEDGQEDFGGPLPFYESQERPFLMFSADDVATIRARIAEEGSVASRIWPRVGDICDREMHVRPEPNVYDPYTEVWNATIARACAFEGLIGEDPQRLRKAAEIMLAMQPDVRHTSTAYGDLDKSTILGGPAVMGYALAYDLLMAEPEQSFLSEDEALQARELLLEHADQLVQFYMDDWPVVLMLTTNNHNIKHAAGVGMAALAVPDDEGALERLSFGTTELMFHLFQSQFTGDGGYAEGPSYLDYSAVSYFPFLYALHRAMQGAPIDLYHSCATTLNPECQPGVRSTPDPWLDGRFELLHGWAFGLVMPNGGMVPFDDSHISTFPWPYVETQLPGGPWMWFWHKGNWPLATGGSPDLTADFLSLPIDLESIPDPQGLAPLSQVWSEGGQAVFRTGWDADDGFVLLLGEHGKARYGGHEHPDETSFSWYVGGEYAFIDTGYFGYTDRLLTATADQHSLVLVDGLGPPTGVLGNGDIGVDAFIEDCDLELANFQTCRVRTRYRRTGVNRRLVMIGDRALVLADLLQSDTAVEFTHLLHGGAPIENAELSATGSRWTIGQLVMEAVVLSPDQALSYELAERVDTSTAAQRHAVLQSSTQPTEQAAFLTLLIRRTDEDTPQVSVQSTTHRAEIELADDGGDLLSVVLCTDSEACAEGLSLEIPTRADGLLPEIEADLVRQWALVGTAP